MKQKEIMVLMIEPGKHPKVTTIKNDLDSLQKAVSIGCEQQGLIEIVGIEDRVCILCNEEGKLSELDAHLTVSRLLGHERADVTNIYLSSIEE